jgi:hypothetical protein
MSQGGPPFPEMGPLSLTDSVKFRILFPPQNPFVRCPMSPRTQRAQSLANSSGAALRIARELVRQKSQGAHLQNPE